MQDASANRPKRYSSLRQRPTIAEGPGQQNFPSPHGQHTFYPSQGNVFFFFFFSPKETIKSHLKNSWNLMERVRI